MLESFNMRTIRAIMKQPKILILTMALAVLFAPGCNNSLLSDMKNSQSISDSTYSFNPLFTRDIANNPVLDLGPSGAFDDNSVFSPTVIIIDGTYYMYYSSDDASNYRIGLATSTDGITWTKDDANNPVLDLGSSGAFDDFRVANPEVIIIGDTYHMYYSGNDGSYDRIGHATSADGITWIKDDVNNPVLDLGPSGDFDDARVTAPSVQLIGSTYHMYYTGSDGSRYRIGHATSTDGVVWTKDEANNPVLDLGSSGNFDDYGVGFPAVILIGNICHMYYYGYDGSQARIGHATSVGGVTWTKDDANNPVLGPGASGAFDNPSVSTPAIIFYDGTYHMYYGGYNGTHWRIGHATN